MSRVITMTSHARSTVSVLLCVTHRRDDDDDDDDDDDARPHRDDDDDDDGATRWTRSTTRERVTKLSV